MKRKVNMYDSETALYRQKRYYRNISYNRTTEAATQSCS